MKELDINKSMTRRGNLKAKIKFCSYIKRLDKGEVKKKLLVIETFEDETETAYIVEPNGAHGIDDSWDIINEPEKPFSWDSPIRSNNTGNICVAKYRMRGTSSMLLIFKDLTTHELTYDLVSIQNPPDWLENYESEDRYSVKTFPYFDERPYHVYSHSEKKIIGQFDKEEDAILFKQIKEQGL